MSRRPAYLIVACSVIFAVIFFTILYKDTIVRQLDAWKLLPRSERVTELYFTDHSAVSKTYAPKKEQTVAFTIHNLEQQATQYYYAVVARGPKAEEVLAVGTTQLQQGESNNVVEKVVIPALGKRIEIQVRLDYSGILPNYDQAKPQSQSIHYWVTQVGSKEQPT